MGVLIYSIMKAMCVCFTGTYITVNSCQYLMLRPFSFIRRPPDQLCFEVCGVASILRHIPPSPTANELAHQCAVYTRNSIEQGVSQAVGYASVNLLVTLAECTLKATWEIRIRGRDNLPPEKK